MSRVIRNVPPNFVPPRVPHHDTSFTEACAAWDENERLWQAGTHPDFGRFPDIKGKYPSYGNWVSPRPTDRTLYRPPWAPEDATAFMVYEEITEGTPCSPALPTREALIDWLMQDGSKMGIGGRRYRMDAEEAEEFVEAGYRPSLAFRVAQ